MSVKLGKKCPKCGSDIWECLDKTKWYIEICDNCRYNYEITKQDYVNNFECPDCGGLSGTLEENDSKLGVRCNNCGKLHIMLEKHTTINHRHQQESSAQQTKVPHCPTCNSTRIRKISATKKIGGAIGFGLFSKSARSQFECLDCKYKW